MSLEANGQTIINQDRSIGFIPGIQILRAFAAVLVVVIHIQGAFINAGRDVVHGLGPLQVGVDVFFVVSGFVMMYAERASGPIPAARFLLRRLIRIVPLYWLLTTVELAIYVHANRHHPLHLSQVRRFVTSYLFWPHANVPGDKNDIAPLYIVGWTLNYELFFYFVYALAMFVHDRFRLYIIILVFTVLVSIGQVFDVPLPFFFWSSPIVLEFVFGMVIARLYMARIQAGTVQILALLPLSFAVFLFGSLHWDLVVDWIFPFRALIRVLAWGMPSALLVWCVVCIPWSRDIALVRMMVFLGGASYSLYLIHDLLLSIITPFVAARIGPDPSVPLVWVTVASVVVLTAICGSIVYLVIERPSYRAMRKLVG